MDHANAIEIRNLSYRYPDGTIALDNISLDIFEGEKVAIVGANGAGKSTLMHHLNGILKGRGEISIFGIRVEDKNLREIRKRVGLVFQNPDDQLFTPTIYEDVAFGPRNMGMAENQVAEKVKYALDRVGLGGKDYMRRSAFHLSFGEKKRASIATVLAMEPSILALDEPTGNLDPKGRREIEELLGTIDVTQVIVTHDLNLARSLCERAVVMNAGRIAASGKPDEIFADPAFLLDNDLA